MMHYVLTIKTVNVEHELMMNRTEMSMIRWMCGVKLNVKTGIDELL